MQLLDKSYKRTDYLEFLNDTFSFSQTLKPITIDNQAVKSFEQLGFITTSDGKQLPVFEIHITSNTKLQRNRVQLRNLVAKQIQSEDGALAVYVDGENKQWRFSFIAIEYKYTGDGIKTEQTASKRFTYLLGVGTQTRTAKERFETLNKHSILADLKTAFAVEALNKEFYGKLYKWYDNAKEEVTFPNDENAQSHTQTSLIRLLTRLLFIWFLKEKKLINPDLFKQDKLESLIDWQQNSSFYKAILQNLFFATLNRQIKDRDFRRTTNGNPNNTNYLASNIYRYQKYFKNREQKKIIDLFQQTPFLNGGLFECLDREASDKEKQAYDNDSNIRLVKSAIRIDGFSDRADNEMAFSNSLFFNDEESGLCDLFGQYQFTVEESTPLDIEVALDPELLGKVFENLLATYNPETGEQARKATGSFYTPREIVSYMVDESLKQYFKTHTDLDDEVDNLFIEGESTLNEKQIKTVINAIDKLKILDPAVGSGAYPMGILQKLLFILEKIDKTAKYFRKQQLKNLPDLSSIERDLKTAKKISDQKAKEKATEELQNRKRQIEDNFQNQDHNYLRKLHLIENSIYGVDIQAIAIQICKLRFFISLAIEHKPNKNADDNYGIKALPNLETKFIVANTLLPLGEIEVERGQTQVIFDMGIKDLQDNLAQVRHQYFTAKTLKTKRKYRQKDKDLRLQMQDRISKIGVTPEVEKNMQKVVDWDLYNQNAQSDWFDPEWMFGVKDGFDIVLGNPPYIMEDDNKQAFDNLHSHPCYQGKTDIWHLFVGSGLNFANKQGSLTYIAKNQWLCSASASNMRNIIYQKSNIKKIIDFGSNMIFENADQQTMILELQKDFNNKNHSIEYIKFDKLMPIEAIKQTLSDGIKEKSDLFVSNKILPKHYDKTENLTFSSSAKENILTKIYNKKNFEFEGKKEIIQGIIGGPDKAFIVKENELMQFTAQEKEYLKMLHTNTGRYTTLDTEKYIFYISKKNFQTIKNYPNMQRKLLKYEEKLKHRREVLNGRIRWFDLWWARDENFFKDGAKLVWAKRTEGKKFTYTQKSMYGTANLFFIKSSRVNLKYMAALLNSKLMYFYMNEKLKHTGDLLQIDKNQFMKIPLFVPNCTQNFEVLMDKILTAKKDGKDTSDYETKIDQMVYKLYNLSTAEIKIIEAEK